ncbi:MAG: hypothetical protein ACE5IY_15560 [bacterium]
MPPKAGTGLFFDHPWMLLAAFMVVLTARPASSQVQFPWPVTPFDQSQEITGSFAEYRSTSPNGHFHNGTDIPKPDGSPVYPVKDGVVTSLSTQGSSAFVRVQDVAYVHISPNPALSIGDSVFTSETVLGTILSGLGHVHFTNGFVGSEKNSLLPGSGLTPYEDPWPPIIRFIKFYQNKTANELPADRLSGPVDIVVKVDEQNGPPTTRTSRRNNGTYKIGYKILSADTSTVVFEPPAGGVRFQFDTKPSNSFVNIVYFRSLSSTTSHVYQVTNDVSQDNFWNTSALPVGDYVVMVFTEDTRANVDTVFAAVTIVESDLEAPAQPAFKFVKEIEGGLRLAWFPNGESDLAGYRLAFSFDNQSWSLFRDENVFTAGIVDTTILQVLNRDVYFRLSAVDEAPLPNESVASDVYGMSNGSFLKKVLLVDGFDRQDGGWTQPNHFFVFTHGQALVANQFSFDTAANEAVEAGLVDLNGYEAVFWILGDESTETETFSTQEQALVQTYLAEGGALFLSGANVARDLDVDTETAATPEDDAFLHDFLRADFAGKAANRTQVTGLDDAIFEGLQFDFGQTPYGVETPDLILPVGEGAVACARYATGEIAAIQSAGLFGEGVATGRLVYTTFPFETISDEAVRNEVFARVLQFFFDITSVAADEDTPASVPEGFWLAPNYPNPFNPATTIEYGVPAESRVAMVVYNLLGEKVRTLVQGRVHAGVHRVSWRGRDDLERPVSAGVYILSLRAEEVDAARRFERTQTIVLLK